MTMQTRTVDAHVIEVLATGWERSAEWLMAHSHTSASVVMSQFDRSAASIYARHAEQLRLVLLAASGVQS